EVGLDHADQCPALEVPALNRRIEEDHASRPAYAQAELDVSDPRDRLVEAPQAEKRVSANGSEPGPERRGEPGSLSVQVMMEKISEVRDHAVATGLIVVRPEDGRQRGILLEHLPDSHECVGVYFHIGVDEDQNFAIRLPGAGVTCSSRD